METELEHILITSHKDEMIVFMDGHPEYFEEAIKLSISDKQPYAWRAAWLLWSYMKENDLRIQGYVKQIINTLTTKTDAHLRELLKILIQMKLDSDQEGYLFDVCSSIWEKVNKKPSIRFNAFKFMVKIVKKHPELSNELTLLTQEKYIDLLSPAANKSIAKMMKDIS